MVENKQFSWKLMTIVVVYALSFIPLLILLASLGLNKKWGFIGGSLESAILLAYLVIPMTLLMKHHKRLQ
jgi:hypothetical protein